MKKITAGHYRIGNVDIVRVEATFGYSASWITRSSTDERDTYGAFPTLRDAKASL